MENEIKTLVTIISELRAERDALKLELADKTEEADRNLNWWLESDRKARTAEEELELIKNAKACCQNK